MDFPKKSLWGLLMDPLDCSSSTVHWSYDVFLSFRGEDTRKNFTDHLYRAMVRAGIRTFRHDHDLPRGHDLSQELSKAIMESKLSIVVFSKDYASSEWCLEELVKIVESKEVRRQLIVPVFYDVDQNDVREQKGHFAEAFERHEVVFAGEMVKVERWRFALREATRVAGWDLQNVANGYEARFIQEIVRHVLEKVKIKKLHVAKHPVGLESRVKKLVSLLKIGSEDVRMVGIYGMGGIGKSTITKSFYNSAFHLFEGSCFLANIREASDLPNGLARLQEQLLSETLKTKKFKVANDHVGVTFLKERLCHKRVLIILDDLDQLNQLEKLAGQHHWFGAGSRIVLTTRNEHLLSQAKVDEKYEVKKLNHRESLRLFSWHAFRKPFPLVNYKNLSNEIVSYSGGLPLALEVLGASLLGQTTLELWHSTLEKLSQIPPNKILEKLRISFETLYDDKVKDIFLDIAFFFIGMDKDYVTDVFNGCGFFPGVGISILVDRCLLRISKKNKLRMHDLVRDMGREIVREKFPCEPGKRTRLWSQKDVLDILMKHEGSQAIEGLVLDLVKPMHLATEAFGMMHKLRLLQINNVHLRGSFEGLFKELRWLCWHHCPLDCLPAEFHPGKLVFLDVQHNKFNTLWKGTKFLGNLKILNVGESEVLTTTPDFSGVPNLERLSIASCPHLSNVDNSIGLLDKLISLDLGLCYNLKSLPGSICNLKSLEKLSLRLCSKLDKLPEKLGDMKCLRDLQLSASPIKEIPDSIGFLGNLNMLGLSECKNLQYLPGNICSLTSLEYLYINGCSSLDNLPEQLGNMRSLKVIGASGTAVKQLPESMGLLGELTGLHLEECKNLRSLPSSVCNLISLEILNLGRCLNVGLQGAARLWNICLSNLTRLTLRDCNLSDEDIPHNLGAFSYLEELCLEGNRFCSLPSTLCLLSNLNTLQLGRCRSLRVIQELPPNLSWLNANDCTSLEKLPNLSNLKYLESMEFRNCGKLVEIQGLENLYLIQTIHLESCSNLSTTFKNSLIQGTSGLVHNCAIYFSRMHMPYWFKYQTTGMPSISFDVPLDVENDSLGMIIWADYVFGKLGQYSRQFYMHIINKTTSDKVRVVLSGCSFDVGTWVRHVSQECPIRRGDKVEVYLEVKNRNVSGVQKMERNVGVEKYGVQILNVKQNRHAITTDLSCQYSRNKLRLL